MGGHQHTVKTIVSPVRTFLTFDVAQVENSDWLEKVAKGVSFDTSPKQPPARNRPCPLLKFLTMGPERPPS